MHALAVPALSIDRRPTRRSTREGRTAQPVPVGWLVVEDEFDPDGIRSAETVFSIGNGRFSTRGSFEERYPGDQPATLMHGVFAPHAIAMSELANLPDWTALDIVVDGHRFTMTSGRIIRYRRVLDLRSGLLRRDVTWRSPAGATVGLCFERFASFADQRLAAVRATVTSIDFAGTVEVRAGLAAQTDTDGLAHLAWRSQRVSASTAELVVDVRDADTAVAMAMRFDVRGAATTCEGWDVRTLPTLTARWTARPGESASFDKLVVLVSTRDDADPPGMAATGLAALADEDFDSMFRASRRAWERDWRLSDVIIEGDPEAQLATRFSIYHLLIAAPRADEQASIGAKTLTGFGYHGHAFWDTETFMLPFFTHVHPSIARDLLSYRYHRLPGARRKACANGYDGAQFPWESAATGDEVTPTWVPDVNAPTGLTRIWTGDIEIHVSAMVAHAVMNYWQATGDDAFMLDRGAEMIIESARFWASRAEWNETARRFEFTDVIGPDEYHEHVDDNAFTNYFAAWHLRTAADLVAWLDRVDPARAAEIIPSAATADQFRSVAAAIHLPRDPASGLIEQFRGYFSRRDVDLADYGGRTSSMQAILGADGVAETQIIKQPDVLMLAYLLPEVMSPGDLAANHAYYDARTDHAYGSSLGPAIAAVLSARQGDPDEAYEHFMRAARADLGDVRGNAADGIHGASAGGLWQALVFGFGGVRFSGDEVLTAPRLPAHWTRLSFRITHRGRVIDVDLRPGSSVASPGASICGLIFDLDGVLTDTAEAHYRAWQRLADEEGLPFDRAANDALRGISRSESLRHLLGARAVGEAEAERLMARKNAHYREIVEAMGPDDLLPGALGLLRAARERGLRIALGSASRNAREVLDRLGIAGEFDAICDGHTVDAPKPAPDLFLAAAAALGLAPETCVVLEDAAAGVAAAHAAGMTAIGIGPVERVGAADLVLPAGLAEVDLDTILQAARRDRAA
jgi:beta-phosphoglucomutase